MKPCRKCKIAARRDNHNGLCRACLKIENRLYYEKNWLAVLIRGAKNRAKKKGIPFGINVEDIQIPTHCPIFGTKFAIGNGETLPNSPSIDRVIPELGYIPGNVILISHRANTIKNHGDGKEHQMIADWLRSLK